jgi:hypothetical protein
MSNEQIEVKIAGKPYTAKVPDYATRYELLMACSENAIRGSAAVLGVCLPGLVPSSYEVHNCNAMRFGAYVWDQLRERGVDEIAMVEAAVPIRVRLAQVQYPAAVEDRTAFFSPSEDAPTSSP